MCVGNENIVDVVSKQNDDCYRRLRLDLQLIVKRCTSGVVERLMKLNYIC